MVGLGEFQLRQTEAQVIWESIDAPKAQPSTLPWDISISDSAKQGQPPTEWEVVPEPDEQSQPPSRVVWEVLDRENKELIPPSQTESNSVVNPPSSLEEAEALLGIIPLKPSDFQPLLRLTL